MDRLGLASWRNAEVLCLWNTIYQTVPRISGRPEKNANRRKNGAQRDSRLCHNLAGTIPVFVKGKRDRMGWFVHTAEANVSWVVILKNKKTQS